MLMSQTEAGNRTYCNGSSQSYPSPTAQAPGKRKKTPSICPYIKLAVLFQKLTVLRKHFRHHRKHHNMSYGGVNAILDIHEVKLKD